MQKIMFLLKMEAANSVGPDFYNFVPYNYGPFDSAVYKDVKELEVLGDLIVEVDGFRSWPTYVLSPKGRIKSDEIRSKLDQQLAQFFCEVVQWVKARTFSDLLRAIYAKYPEYAKNSVFRG